MDIDSLEWLINEHIRAIFVSSYEGLVPNVELLRNVRGTVEIVRENFRMDELRAAIGRTQLPKLDAMNDGRRRIGARYNDGLSDVESIVPVSVPDRHNHVSRWYVE